jgi:hypothetical protein
VGLTLLAAGFAVAAIEACLLFVFAVTGRGWATIGSVLPLAVTGWATWACGQGMVAALTTAQRHQSRHPWEAVLPLQGRWLNYALAAVFALVAGVTGGVFVLLLAVALVTLVVAP